MAAFLKQIDRETPAELALHLIVDNYATHKHPRFHLHFTPTGSIETCLAERNLAPKPYRWPADGASILRKIHAARSKLQSKNISKAAR